MFTGELRKQLAAGGAEAPWTSAGRVKDLPPPTWDGADPAEWPSKRKSIQRWMAITPQPPACQGELLAID